MPAYSRTAEAAGEEWRLAPTPKDYEALGRMFERLALEGRLGETKPAALAIIVPTLNEAANIGPLVAAVGEALAGQRWEIIFVDDDSRDETRAAILAIAMKDRRIRLVYRQGRQGLSSAVIEGVRATTAPFIAVMDADLQHDETLLARMFAALQNNEADLAIGSRFAEDAAAPGLEGVRLPMSHAATALAQRLVRAPLTDPLSGFFMMRRSVFEAAAAKLSGHGHKILLDLLTALPQPVRTREYAYTFRPRTAGVSKLDGLVVWDFALLLADKLFGKIVPARFLSYAAVGAGGVLVHFAVLSLLHHSTALGFAWAQAIATVLAMTSNFFLNNMLTWRDRRLVSAPALLLGLISFYLVCGLGAAANVGVATFLFERDYGWWVSGLAGVMIGAVWNFTATSLTTWRR